MFCACRNEHLWIKLIVLALAGVLALATISTGSDVPKILPEQQSTNPQERSAIECNDVTVRRELMRSAVVLALGTEMDVMEHRGLIESLRNPGCIEVNDPVPSELLALRAALRAELNRVMPSETTRILKQLSEEKLLDAFTKSAHVEAPVSFVMDEFTVEVGFATYHYWQVRVRSEQSKGLLREKADRTIVFPCTKQAYVKLTLRAMPRVRL